MRYKLIGCEVFARPAYFAAAKSRNIIDMEFLKLQSHTDPGMLKKSIQEIMDKTPDQYEAILLCYGLCGNGTAGLKARRLPLVIPRAHDCCTIFLGSRRTFIEYFGQTPSAEWYTACYYERLGRWYRDNPELLPPIGIGSYAELVEKYGEENAKYVMETLNSGKSIDFLTYIDMELPGFDEGETKKAFAEHAARVGKNTRFIKGNACLIEKLIEGEWDEDEFLVIRPGEEIKPVYDHDRVMVAERS